MDRRGCLALCSCAACGCTVTASAQQTRVGLMVRVRFPSVITPKPWLNLSLWLTRHIVYRRLPRADGYSYSPPSQEQRFRLPNTDKIDDPLRTLICAAYRVACQ